MEEILSVLSAPRPPEWQGLLITKHFLFSKDIEAEDGLQDLD